MTTNEHNLNDGGPAYPVLPPLGPDGTSAVGYPFVSSGLSLRDYFAAKAMQAFMSQDMSFKYEADRLARVASKAYAMADSMLKARQS